MAKKKNKKEEKPRIVEIRAYGNTKEEIEEFTRREWEARKEIMERGHDPEFWKEVYEEFFREPFPYPEEKDMKKIDEIFKKKYHEVFGE
ncbi:MAG: hypothetical protein ABIL49_07430 [candidate division WOR-3 bacterium]